MKDGVSTAWREHLPRSTADEQCHNHRREGPQRMPQRDFESTPSIRCPIQDGTRHAGQHQEDRQSRRSRRGTQQAQDHTTGNIQ